MYEFQSTVFLGHQDCTEDNWNSQHDCAFYLAGDANMQFRVLIFHRARNMNFWVLIFAVWSIALFIWQIIYWYIISSFWHLLSEQLWTCKLGKPSSWQICEQADQPSREAPGFYSYPINFPWRPSIFQDSGTLLYPSVTFCPKYTWKTFPGVKKYCHNKDKHRWANFNFDAKVMEMINKNVSMDFEALKKHARMNYWHIDEVIFFKSWSLFSFLLNYWYNN